MDVLLGWLFNIFELTFFKRNIKGLFPYPDNQVKKAKEETNKQKKSFSSLPWTRHRHLAEDHTQKIYKYQIFIIKK